MSDTVVPFQGFDDSERGNIERFCELDAEMDKEAVCFKESLVSKGYIQKDCPYDVVASNKPLMSAIRATIGLKLDNEKVFVRGLTKFFVFHDLGDVKEYNRYIKGLPSSTTVKELEDLDEARMQAS